MRLLLVGLFGLVALPAMAQSSGACAAILADAQAAFDQANFARAIDLLTPCADQDAPVAVYRLLSLTHLNAGDSDAARAVLERLLLAFPAYTPDPVQDPPSYTVLVLIVREQLQEAGRLTPIAPPKAPPWYKRRGPWAAIGVGLVAVGLVALFAGD